MIEFEVAIFLILLIPLLLKRKRQVGKTWEGLVLTKVEINHMPLLCRHCNSEKFCKREALITTTVLTLLRWPFLNQSGVAYECILCGYIAWFSRPKETMVEIAHPTYSNQTFKVISSEPSK